MSVVVSSSLPPPDTRRWTLDEYHRLIRGGNLTEDDSVELLEGWIVSKMSRNADHDLAIEDLEDALRPMLPAGFRIRVQCALTVASSESEPAPDLIVCTSQDGRRGRHPEPGDTSLVVEVADSSLRGDRGRKLRIYANGGIPVHWIVNLNDRQVEVYTDPTGPSPRPKYRSKQIYRNGSKIPVSLNDDELGTIVAKSIFPK